MTKRAIISGASSGIGLATARQLCKEGWAITVIGRKEAALFHVIDSLQALREDEHHFLVADFEVPQTIIGGLSCYDCPAADQLAIINNVGGPGPKNSLICQAIDYQNLFNKFMLSFNEVVMHFAPMMKASRWGRVINILGTTVLAPIPGMGLSVVKSMTAAWGKALSVELGPFGITVNNVLPGPTDTPELHALVNYFSAESGLTPEAFLEQVTQMMPVRRVAKPEEIADAIAFLVSSKAGFITGTNFRIDGGYLPCL